MKSTDRPSLTIVQMNDTHAYFDIHQEMFWQGDHAVYLQAGGYARIATIVRCLGLNVYFKIENPSGNRIQKIFAGNAEMQPDQYYSAAFVTMQGVPQKYGRNRENQSDRIIDVLRKYLSNHRPVCAELRGTFIAV